jgi:hypothetical protein
MLMTGANHRNDCVPALVGERVGGLRESESEAVMSAELDELVAAFAELQEKVTVIRNPDDAAIVGRAIDALMMAIGSIESRLNMIEHSVNALSAGTARQREVAKAKKDVPQESRAA